MRRIYDENILKFITLFESLSGARVKDCIIDEEKIIYIVEKGDMGLAIGKHASNLRRIESILKKPVRIIEFNEDMLEFVKNYAYPLNMFELSFDNKVITIKGKDTKTKAMLIGRDRSNLKKMSNIVGRFFQFDDIKVI